MYALLKLSSSRPPRALSNAYATLHPRRPLFGTQHPCDVSLLSVGRLNGTQHHTDGAPGTLWRLPVIVQPRSTVLTCALPHPDTEPFSVPQQSRSLFLFGPEASRPFLKSWGCRSPPAQGRPFLPWKRAGAFLYFLNVAFSCVPCLAPLPSFRCVSLCPHCRCRAN